MQNEINQKLTNNNLQMDKILRYELETGLNFTVTDIVVLQEIINGCNHMQTIKEKHNIKDYNISRSVSRLSDNNRSRVNFGFIKKHKDEKSRLLLLTQKGKLILERLCNE